MTWLIFDFHSLLPEIIHYVKASDWYFILNRGLIIFGSNTPKTMLSLAFIKPVYIFKFQYFKYFDS